MRHVSSLYYLVSVDQRESFSLYLSTAAVRNMHSLTMEIHVA